MALRPMRHRLPTPFIALVASISLGCLREPKSEISSTVVAAIEADPGQLNPAITTQGGVQTASALLYDGLVSLNDSLQPIPSLAQSWSIEDGGRVYRFALRHSVRWHDGVPFSAADVKFSFDSVLLRFHSRTRAPLSTALVSIETPDSFTVVFRFKHPYAPLLQQLRKPDRLEILLAPQAR